MNRTVPADPRAHPLDRRDTSSGDRWDKQGRRLCRGRLRRSGIACRNAALKGRDFCLIHGGRARIGVANGNFRNGRYSRVLGSTPLAEAFEAARNDPALISLREHIAAFDARLEELFGRLGPNSQANWEQAIAQYRAWRQLHGVEGMEAQALAAQQAFERTLSEGASAEQVWTKLDKAAEARRRLTDTEGKHEDRLHQTFSVSNAQAFAAAMSALAKEFVPPERLAEFVNALRLLTMNGIDTRQEPRRPETHAGN